MALRWTAFVLLLAALVASPVQVQAGGGVLGPSMEELQQAKRLAASFRAPGGLERGLRLLCRREEDFELPSLVASAVLVERATAAMPKLLAAIAAADAPGFAAHAERNDEIYLCWLKARDIAKTAVCDGKAVDYYDVDRRTEPAVQRSRAAAQRAILDALAARGPRRGAALDVLLHARPPDEPSEWCTAGADLVHRATPTLARMLAAKDDETAVLRLISKGDVDPRVAVPAIRPYLADKKHVVLAALGLARMGEDMASAVPQIAEHLDATDEYELKEVLDALAQIGPGARAALPRLATLTKRLDAYCLRPVRADRLVEVVAALATRPDDAGAALPALTPFLSRCPDAFQRAIGTLAKLGNDGWKPLLSYLRDDDRPAGARHEVARVVMRAGAPTTKADQEVVRLLEAREARRPPPRPESMSQLPDPPPPEPDPLIVTEEGVAMCRAEAGRPPVAVTGITAEQARKVGPCLKGYLCGPSQRTFTQTLDRCCGPVFGAQRPAFCRP